MATGTLKINGQEVEVEKGSTILQAAEKAGIYVPVLCYHPLLPLEEACRICVVEDVRGDWSTLVAACVYPVRNGMVIQTDSPMVIEARKTIMELLLSDHPNDCMTCYATGSCELQDLAHIYQVKSTKYEGARHKYTVDSDPSPYLFIDMNKCILCRRCIRACHEIQGADIWTKVGRGFDQRISTAFGLPLAEAGCEDCGHCADFCPVDAIGYRVGRGEVRSWQLKGTATICLHCPSGCRAQYDTLKDKVVRVVGNAESPSNRGALCKAGRFNFNFINSPDRLRTAAMQNAQRELVPCSTDEALDAAAAALQKVRDSHGVNSIAVLCGSMLTNEEYYLAQKLARCALFTNHVDNASGAWQQAIHEAMSASLGFGAMPGSLQDIERAGAVLVMGSNTIEKHAMAAIRARKAARGGAPLIVVHPSPVPMTKTANMHLAIKAGSESALLQGLIKVILTEELYDKAFVEKCTQDFAKLERSVQKINLGDVAEKTGLSEEQIRDAGRLYASRRPACLVHGAEPLDNTANESFYRNCVNLQLLLGSVGVPGGTPCLMGFGGNGQGAGDFGALPKYLPGYRPVTSSPARKTAAKVWGVSPPDKPGMHCSKVFEAIERGEIKGLYLIGLNPLELVPNKKRLESALARLDVLVVQDCLSSELCEAAQVVLPAVTFVEKRGTATNCERRIQRLQPVLALQGDVRSDFDLINGLLGRLDGELQADSLESAFAEAGQLISDLNGLSHETIAPEGVQWPVGDGPAGAERIALPEGEKSKFKFAAVK
ncbi:MAG: molybdopterin-dependent oxidoreductase [Deltaproteobacteria bacterium]|nr:molybdopterin-dependent oxidoreductase [Deltaproteobacteria bacterium]